MLGLDHAIRICNQLAFIVNSTFMDMDISTYYNCTTEGDEGYAGPNKCEADSSSYEAKLSSGTVI